MRLNRRDLLKWSAQGALAYPLAAGLVGLDAWTPYAEAAQTPFQGTNDQLLDEIQRASFEFFWQEASAATGQVKDRALLNGNDNRRMASIAATGFGLTALCIGDARGFRKPEEIRERVRATLRFLADKLPNVHGFYYHFIDIESGARWEKVELSSIDTSLLLCGVLTARQHFADAEIQDLATKIYNRVDWPWMLNGGNTFSMGWHPENGFLKARWEHYCELMMIYLLAIGSPTHAVSPDTWKAWKRPKVTFEGITFVSGNDPIFTHQYSQAWFDFRGKKDTFTGTNYFENSVLATKAHKLFCLSLKPKFPDYSEDLWGISASDYEKGYTAWGGPPAIGPLDGSIVPCATGGSLPFLPDDCLRVLRNIRGKYAAKAWGKYSFVDAFNPLDGWYDPDVLGIDLGITIVMAENHRTGMVWDTFMKNAEMKNAMEKAGFRHE